MGSFIAGGIVPRLVPGTKPEGGGGPVGLWGSDPSPQPRPSRGRGVFLACSYANNVVIFN